MKKLTILLAILSHNSEYTKNVEQMVDAVTFDGVKRIAENAGK